MADDVERLADLVHQRTLSYYEGGGARHLFDPDGDRAAAMLLQRLAQPPGVPIEVVETLARWFQARAGELAPPRDRADREHASRLSP